MSDSVRPHRRQPTRLPRPWNSPDKNTGVGCHFLLQCMKVKSESEVAQSGPTLSDPMDHSLSGSSIHGIFQARVLEWGAIAFSSDLENTSKNTEVKVWDTGDWNWSRNGRTVFKHCNPFNTWLLNIMDMYNFNKIIIMKKYAWMWILLIKTEWHWY